MAFLYLHLFKRYEIVEPNWKKFIAILTIPVTVTKEVTFVTIPLAPKGAKFYAVHMMK